MFKAKPPIPTALPSLDLIVSTSALKSPIRFYYMNNPK